MAVKNICFNVQCLHGAREESVERTELQPCIVWVRRTFQDIDINVSDFLRSDKWVFFVSLQEKFKYPPQLCLVTLKVSFYILYILN